MKDAKYRVHETVGFDFGPLFKAVSGQADLINRLFIRGVGVKTRTAHGVVEFVYFIRHGKLSGSLRLGVNFGVNLCAARFVGSIEMLFVERSDAIEMGFFCLVVESA